MCNDKQTGRALRAVTLRVKKARAVTTDVPPTYLTADKLPPVRGKLIEVVVKMYTEENDRGGGCLEKSYKLRSQNMKKQSQQMNLSHNRPTTKKKKQ